MKLKNLILASLAIAGVLAATSCKKEKADNDIDNDGIDISLFDGQWMCNLLLENDGPMYEYPYILWNLDATGKKADIYPYYGVSYSASFDVSENQLIIKQGSSSTHYDITKFDQKHMVLVETYNSDKYEYHFSKMNSIILGTWGITWYRGKENEVTQFYRFDEGGTGAWVTSSGSEKKQITWSIEPAKDDCFRFVLTIPDTNPLYRNTFAIYSIFSDNELEGYDNGDNTVYLNRAK